MKNLKCYIAVFLISTMQIVVSQTKKAVDSFNKVVISPHIEAVLVEGNEESVTIKENTLTDDKVNIEIKGKTLRIYLDDAKEVTKTKTVIKNGTKQQIPIYKGKVLVVEITYKVLETLSVRGEQKTQCKSLLKQDDFNLKIYGESQVVLDEVVLSDLDITIYGESQLMIKKGITNKQKITAYGESGVNLMNVENKTSKLRAYGEAEFKINASEEIKITAYGDATLDYKGNASIKKGIAIGDIEVSQID